MNKKIIPFVLMGIKKVVIDFVCDKGLPKVGNHPKKFDIPQYSPQFPKPDLGNLKFPDLPIFR